jgi:hypothetical protein
MTERDEIQMLWKKAIEFILNYYPNIFPETAREIYHYRRLLDGDSTRDFPNMKPTITL